MQCRPKSTDHAASLPSNAGTPESIYLLQHTPERLSSANRPVSAEHSTLSRCISDRLLSLQLEDSEHFGIVWTAQQKQQLLEAVAVCGSHDLNGITQRVDGHSRLECAGYLEALRLAEHELMTAQAPSLLPYQLPIMMDEQPSAQETLPDRILKEENAAQLYANCDDKSYREEMHEIAALLPTVQPVVKQTHKVSHSHFTVPPQRLINVEQAHELSRHLYFGNEATEEVLIGQDTIAELYCSLYQWLVKVIGHAFTVAIEQRSHSRRPTKDWIRLDRQTIHDTLDLLGYERDKHAHFERVIEHLRRNTDEWSQCQQTAGDSGAETAAQQADMAQHRSDVWDTMLLEAEDDSETGGSMTPDMEMKPLEEGHSSVTKEIRRQVIAARKARLHSRLAEMSQDIDRVDALVTRRADALEAVDVDGGDDEEELSTNTIIEAQQWLQEMEEEHRLDTDLSVSESCQLWPGQLSSQRPQRPFFEQQPQRRSPRLQGGKPRGRIQKSD